MKTSPAASKAPKGQTIGDYFSIWVARKVAPIVRVTRARDYRNHFRTYILPFVQDVILVELSIEHLEDLKTRLLTERGLSLKTVRNVIRRLVARDGPRCAESRHHASLSVS